MLYVIHRLAETLQAEDVTVTTAPASLSRRVEARFGEDRRSTKSMVAKKAVYQLYVAIRCLDKNGLRPFGSRASQSQETKRGARMRTQQSLTRQPLRGVL